MLATARRAWDLLSPQAGGLEAFSANLALGTALVLNGRGSEGAPRLRRAVAILEESEALSRDPRVLSDAALGPLWLREATTGRGLIDRAIQAARAQSALGVLPFALMLAARDAATSDRWGLGDALYDESIRLARETGQTLSLCGALAGLACLDARRGREEACRRHAGEACAIARERGLGFLHMWALEALADLELGLGRPGDAIAPLTEKVALLDDLGIRDPDVSPMPELVEARVRMGRDIDPPGRLDDFLRLAEEKGQPWILARAWRCRALLAGDDDLDRAFSLALEHHARTPDRFDEAHTRLCYGERLRRARRRAQAREQLRAALDAFNELGAGPWADRARAELAATGETPRRRDASTADRLTPQELQIAMTLAEGHTTREAATKLFLSPKTVEYHLRNVYRKLGVRSRDALAAALRGPGPPESRRRGPGDV
jgi:DNA-binding CsgD family transcriptional regulator